MRNRFQLSRFRKKYAAFTLVELLVVLTIIAALAAIVTPVTQNAIAKAREVRCSQQIAVLVLAIDSYKLEYGTIPLWIQEGAPETSDSTLNTQGISGNAGFDFLACLMGEDTATFKNPRGMTFFEPQYTESGRNGYGVPTGYPTQKGYLDPWGKPFQVTLDYDANGEVRLRGDMTSYRKETIVRSAGADGAFYNAVNAVGEDDEDDDIYSCK